MLSLQGLRSHSTLQQLRDVNARINRVIHYHTDVTDTWQTPAEVLSCGRGDCEDYAIAKFYALKALGWDEVNLRIMYVKQHDRRGRQPIAHMVLHARADHQWWVLDNLGRSINTIAERSDLTTVFGFNTTKFWIKDTPTDVNPQNRIEKWRQVVNRATTEPSPFFT